MNIRPSALNFSPVCDDDEPRMRRRGPIALPDQDQPRIIGVYRNSNTRENVMFKRELEMFLDELYEGLPEEYVYGGKDIWAHLATKYGITERKTRINFNGAKRRFLDNLEGNTNKPPLWIKNDCVLLEKFLEVKKKMKETRKARRNKKPKENYPNLAGPEDFEVEEEEEPGDSRHPSFLHRIKQEIHEEIEPAPTDIPAIEPEDQMVEVVQSSQEERVEVRDVVVADPAKRPRGRPKGSYGKHLKRRVNAPAKIGKRRGWRRSARLQNGEAAATIDRRRSSPEIPTSSTASTVSAQTPSHADEYDQVYINQDLSIEQTVRSVEEVRERKAVKRSAVDDALEAGERYKRIKDEYKRRIRELEEELKSSEAEKACAWRMVYEYREKWDKVVRILRKRDIAKVEEKFPELFRM